MEPALKQKGVVVGCDARKHSREFARITAAVFLSRGVPVYLFRDICATPHVVCRFYLAEYPSFLLPLR